jgi:hypothetical protein
MIIYLYNIWLFISNYQFFKNCDLTYWVEWFKKMFYCIIVVNYLSIIYLGYKLYDIFYKIYKIDKVSDVTW